MRHRLREVERSLLAASSIIVIFGAATLIGTHFSADVAAYVMRYAGHEDMHIIEQEAGWRTRRTQRAPQLLNDGSNSIRPARQRKRSKPRCSRSRRCPCRKRNNP